MDNHSRLEVTKFIWGAMGFALAALFFSGGIADGINVFHLIIASILALAAFLGTAIVWNTGASIPHQAMQTDSRHSEKAKRDRIEQALKDLSSEDLVALKRRLSSGEIDDDMLQDYLAGDDGELVNYR